MIFVDASSSVFALGCILQLDGAATLNILIRLGICESSSHMSHTKSVHHHPV